MKTQIKVLFIGILFLLFVSCSEDTSTSPIKESSDPKELSMKQIELPASLNQNNDPQALSVRIYTTVVNTFSNYSIYFTPPSDDYMLNKITYVQDDWTKVWDLPNGFSVKMDYYENNINFGWAIFLTGNDGNNTLNNWKILEAEEDVATKTGLLKYYSFGSSELASQWIYSTDENGVYNVNYQSFSTTNLFEKLEITANPDLSGSINIYKIDGDINYLSKTISWNSDGTGTWEEYDSDGNLIGSGSF